MSDKVELYLLPGTMCDERLWQRVIDKLDSRYVAHYIDLPLADSIEKIVSQLRAQLPDQPIHLLGFSLGGYIAAQYALTFPERVERLMILANSPAKLPTFEIKMRKLALDIANKHGYGGIFNAKIKQLLAPQHHDSAQIVDLIKAMDKRGGHEKFVSQISGTTHREDLTAQLSALNKPTRFVFGHDDRLVNKARLLGLDASQVDTSVIANCGHMITLEQPDAVVSNIEQFF